MNITTSGVILTKGDNVLVSSRGADEGFGRRNEVMKIYCFKKKKDMWLIGIVANERRSGWGDLDGQVRDHSGTWIKEDRFFQYFALEAKPIMVISKSHKFRKLDLQGMKCIVLSSLPKGNGAMVEFEKDVGGCGGDGLGKAGHCLIIPNGKLVKCDKEQKEGLTKGKE